MFVFDLGGPTAPSRVERRTEGSAAQGSRSAFEVGLGLGLLLRLGLFGGLVAEFLTGVSLTGNVQPKKKASSATLQSQSEVEGKWKDREVDSAVFKDICNWSKCILKLIFEVAR